MMLQGHVLENPVVTAAQSDNEQNDEHREHASDTEDSENDSAQADEDDKSIEDRAVNDLELAVLKWKIYRKCGKEINSKSSCELM
ncbi:unnamed protein product [Gongylonema pulchrum]|uniref:Ovule protein n=1 Tax=Gongylonema pulchrum TaxID=637853 RepID=A0A183DJQ3_9BILA|nr:unnamed protein product [Gongylonema pulchrum]